MPLSFFRNRSMIGLDLGHHSIKAVQIERAGNGWRVVQSESIRTPEGAIKDGVVVDQESLGAAIKDLIRKGRFGATNACISVAGGSVVVRCVRIPKMPEATLRKSIKFEAGRYVPSSVDDSFIEFEIIGSGGDNQMDVLIVAAPRNIVDSRVKACESAGLSVDVVDVEAFAAFRALVEADDSANTAEDTIALIDIGSNSTDVSVISRGVFAMTRSIPQGGAVLTDALRSYFKLDPADAESGKAQLDFRELLQDGPIENPPLRVLQPHIDDLIREIRRSINYYQSQQTESGAANPVNAVLVTGGGARMTGLAEYVGSKLDLPVRSAGVYVNPRFTHAGPTEDPGFDLSVATGLAMRGELKAA